MEHEPPLPEPKLEIALSYTPVPESRLGELEHRKSMRNAARITIVRTKPASRRAGMRRAKPERDGVMSHGERTRMRRT